MKPTHVFDQWKATFATGTGITAWIGAVCALGFGVALALEGVVGWMEVILFGGTVAAWAMSQGRQRWATARTEHKTDLTLLALNQLSPEEAYDLNYHLDDRSFRDRWMEIEEEDCCSTPSPKKTGRTRKTPLAQKKATKTRRV